MPAGSSGTGVALCQATGFSGFCAERVDHFEHRKAVKLGIAGNDLSDAVLKHGGHDLGLVHEFALEVGQLLKDALDDRLVAIASGEDVEGWSGEDRLNKRPRLLDCPGLAVDAWIARESQEVKENRPGEVPGSWLLPPLLQERAARFVIRIPAVRSNHQDICIDHEHLLAAFLGSPEGFAVGNGGRHAFAVEGRQRGQILCPCASSQQQSERRLDEFGHRPTRTRRLCLEPGEHRVVYVQGRLHGADTENHIGNMGIWQLVEMGVGLPGPFKGLGVHGTEWEGQEGRVWVTRASVGRLRGTSGE